MHTMIILPDMPQALFVVHQKCYLSNSAKAVMILNGSIKTETPVSNTSPSYIGMGFRISGSSMLTISL